jgi:hypothetical protein
MGFIEVPRPSRFINSIIAGVSGIDFGLLMVTKIDRVFNLKGVGQVSFGVDARVSLLDPAPSPLKHLSPVKIRLFLEYATTHSSAKIR